MTYEFSLLGSARQVWVADRAEYSELALRLEAAQRLGPRLFARETASWHQRTYEDSGGLTGPRWQVSLNLSWQATPTLSVGANAGYSAEEPRVSHQRNSRPWVQVSANYALPWGFTVGASANFYRTTYESDPYWAVLTRGEDTRRKDRGRTYRLTLLNRAFTLGGFSPQLIAIYEERESNAQLSSFKRFRGDLRAVRQFCGMETAASGESSLGPIAVVAIAGAILLAVAAAFAWLDESPADSERLEQMGCWELAAEVLEGSEAKRRAALEIFVRKKCL